MALTDEVEARDAALFTARRGEQRLLTDFLADSQACRIAMITGTTGVGKSALLRQVGRRAGELDYDVVAVDARELGSDESSLTSALAPAFDATRPLLLLDSYERVRTRDAFVRDHLLTQLPAGARVVVADRAAPDPAWLRSVWAGSMLRVPLSTLSRDESIELLRGRGCGETSVHPLVAWADGLPLALVLGSTVLAQRDGRYDLVALEPELLQHLVESELDDADPGLLAVAALAPAIDEDLLRAVLPGTNVRAGQEWLRGLTFSESSGRQVRLSPQVRRLLAAELRRTEPDLERRLRVRIIDHLAGIAVSGRPHLMAEIREVLSPPEDRGFTPTSARAAFEVDTPGIGDEAQVARLLAHRDPAYVGWVLRWIEEAPDHVIVLRDATGIAAVALWAVPGHAPAIADDPILHWWLAHVARHAPDGNALLQLATEIFTDADQVPEADALIRLVLATRCGLANPRWWFLMGTGGGVPDATACGGSTLPDFSVRLGSEPLMADQIDFGAGGLIESMRQRARTDLAPSHPQARELGALSTAEVRDVLRTFHQPLALASHRLAFGADAGARAESVRHRVLEAVETVFGDTEDEQLHRAILERAYLHPDGAHDRAMRALHLSRTTYYRRLREATDRVTEYLSDYP
jgi:predicted ATPase